jgi:hypothetical protein
MLSKQVLADVQELFRMGDVFHGLFFGEVRDDLIVACVPCFLGIQQIAVIFPSYCPGLENSFPKADKTAERLEMSCPSSARGLPPHRAREMPQPAPTVMNDAEFLFAPVHTSPSREGRCVVGHEKT